VDTASSYTKAGHEAQGAPREPAEHRHAARRPNSYRPRGDVAGRL